MNKTLLTFSLALAAFFICPTASFAADINSYFANDAEQTYALEISKNGTLSLQTALLKSGPFTKQGGQLTQKVDLMRYDGDSLKGRSAYSHAFQEETAKRFLLEIYSAKTGDLVSSITFSPPYPSFNISDQKGKGVAARTDLHDQDQKLLRQDELTLKVGEETISIDGKTFACIKVARETYADGKKLSTTTEWRAEGIGLVKLVQSSGADGKLNFITMTLKQPGH